MRRHPITNAEYLGFLNALVKLEWEKAARGVDNRFLPWGDHAEPTWACILGSYLGMKGRGPVGRYPSDSTFVLGPNGSSPETSLSAVALRVPRNATTVRF